MMTSENMATADNAPRGTLIAPGWSRRLRSTGESSARFGPCEVCEKAVSDVHIMTLERLYSDTDEPFWYVVSGYARFGHAACLDAASAKHIALPPQ